MTRDKHIESDISRRRFAPCRVTPYPRSHPRVTAHDAINEFESAILSAEKVRPASFLLRVPLMTVLSLSRSLKVDPCHLLKKLPVSCSKSVRKTWYLAILMGPENAKALPWFYLPCRKAIYLFDAWPHEHDSILRFSGRFGVAHAFVSSSQAAERLDARSDTCRFHWLPEAVDPSVYRSLPVEEREIDVIQFGRRYELYHEAISDTLRDRGYSYRFQRSPTELLFRSRSDFINGLARAKISVCVPSSLTHPDRSGDIETMTMRYLQSMASECLVVGYAPKEMIDLFGYNPVIEIDHKSPQKQIIHLLRHYSEYKPLIERNASVVRTHHTWAQRWSAMRRVLEIAGD